MKQVVAQLQRNPGFFTGVYGFCGYHFAANGTLNNNVSDGRLACCNGTADGGDLFAEVRRQNMEFHPVLRLDDPYATAANPQPFIDSFVARAKVEGWTGFNMDWEGHNTTGTLEYFLRFMKLNNAFADGLAAHGLQFTTDVQSVTQPWGYTPDATLDGILGGTRAKLVQMDTYAARAIRRRAIPARNSCGAQFSADAAPSSASAGTTTAAAACSTPSTFTSTASRPRSWASACRRPNRRPPSTASSRASTRCVPRACARSTCSCCP